MIINLRNLKKKNFNLAMVDGGFDPLHDGHIRYFKETKSKLKNCKILCCLASDKYIETKHKIFLTQTQRSIIIDSIKYIDYVIKSNISTAHVLEKIKPKFYVKGKEWKNKLPKEEIEICRKNKIRIIYINTKKSSSTKILSNYVSKN